MGSSKAAQEPWALMDLLERLIDIFGQNGYLAVFIALLLCGAGIPLPEDITLVAGGVITGLGYGNVHTMFMVSMVGVLLGDSTMFLLGRKYGTRVLKVRFVARLLTPSVMPRCRKNSPATAIA